MRYIREIFQALSGGGIKGIVQTAMTKAFGKNLNRQKPADQSVTASVTLVNDDTLAVELPMGGSAFTFDIPVSMALAGGIKLLLAAADGLTVTSIRGTVLFFADGVAPNVAVLSDLTTAIDGGIATAWTFVRITGSVVVSHEGVLQLKFAQLTSNATATKTLANATVVTTQITTA